VGGLKLFDEISVGIIVWVITGIISIFIGYFLSYYRQNIKIKHDDKILIEILGLIKTYPSREDAIKDQLPNLTKTKEIQFLAYNGFALIDKPVFWDTSLNKIVNNWNKAGKKSFKILLLSPDEINIIKKRIERINLGEITPTEKEIINNQTDIFRNTDIFLDLPNKYSNISVELGYFHSDLIWSILIYEDYILWSFYQEGKTAKWARTILLSNKSLIGISLIRNFQDLWERRERLQVPPANIDPISKKIEGSGDGS